MHNNTANMLRGATNNGTAVAYCMPPKVCLNQARAACPCRFESVVRDLFLLLLIFIPEKACSRMYVDAKCKYSKHFSFKFFDIFEFLWMKRFIKLSQ